MKKVGIITYHHYYNYGSALQAYALQKAIEGIDKSYKAEIIDYRAQDDYQRSRIQMLMLRLRRLPTYIKEWNRVKTLQKYGHVLKLKEPAFDKFFDSQFVTNGKAFHSFSDLNKESLCYDIMVTGSDQTWSPQIGFKPAMFLEFGPSNALRIAYAPSIGVSKLSKDQKDYLNLHLQSFESISCRERLGTELLNECVKGKEIVNVLDPTLLLTKDDWNNIAIKPKIEGDYILCYFIGHKEYYRRIAEQLSEDLHLPLYYIPASWQELGKNNILISEAGPREFLGLIRNARLVLTDSFHGTAFSINYRKSFYSFTKIEGGKGASDNSRLYDILSKFHLEDRLYDKAGHIQFSDIDYTVANEHINAERELSLSFLKQALKDNRICSHEDCTGCMACEAVCQHNAIKIEKDSMGFLFPKKDLDCCVSCGLCNNRCPNNTPPVFQAPMESLVATAISDEERNTSTSGGLASVFSRYFIKEGGVVYGCTAVDAKGIHHIRVDIEENVELLKGSKYVQSNMHGVITSIKNDLESGRNVLFIGTPCQVAGLKSFLRKPYESLFTIDFVCHGVPSQQLLNDIISHEYPDYRIDDLKIDFRFKDKKGDSKYGIKLSDINGVCKFKETYPDSRYIAGFLGGMFYRESCYQCHYTNSERVSDITLGDFWDKDKDYMEVGNNGLSMLLVNSAKGKFLLNTIYDRIRVKKANIDELVSRNAQLRHPIKRHHDYNSIKICYLNGGYNDIVNCALDKEIDDIHRTLRKIKLANVLKQNAIGKKGLNLIKRFR